MKIVHLATSMDGGAGIAARRIVEAQIENGMNSSLVVANSRSVVFKAHEKKLNLSISSKLQSKSLTLAQRILIQNDDLLVTPISISLLEAINPYLKSAEIVHIHAFYNLLKISDFAKLMTNKKIFITLHDERLFTGGCHYSMGCVGFRESCENCPQVRKLSKSIPRISLQSALSSWRSSRDPKIIAPSEWLAIQARSSELLKKSSIYTVSNPVPSTFQTSQQLCSGYSNPGELTIGFISENLNNPFKGLEVLRSALAIVGGKRKIHLKLFGSGDPGVFLESIKLSKSKFSNQSEAQVAITSCDLLVVPSIQDNSPSVIAESLMCGVPVIGSKIGGIPETLNEFGQSLFSVGNAGDLAEKIMNFSPAKFDANLMLRIRKRYSYRSSAIAHKKLYELA